MSEAMSLGLVLGTLRRPAQVTTLKTGSQCALFEVLVRKKTPTGGWFTVSVPCKAWGKSVDIARSLQAGQALLFRGELAIHKGPQGDTLCLSGFDLEPFSLPPVPDAASVSRN